MVLYDHVNVREGPGTEYSVIGQVHEKETFPVIEEKNEWIQIDLGDQQGWVAKEFTKILDEEITESEDMQSSYKQITIPRDHTHIRKGPSVETEILMFARKDDSLTVLEELEDWLKVEIKDQTGYIHKSFIEGNSKENVLKGKTIIIDPGHGGYDVGAISISGLYEKDFALTTAKKLKNVLTSLGVKVIMTRDSDEFIRLGSRVSLSNLIKPDIFISIHYNSFPEVPSVQGISTFYYDQKDKKLAEVLQKYTVLATNSKDRDALYENLQVLRHNQNKAVLMELGFISNPDEERLLLTDEYQNYLVEGIVSGLINYYMDEKSLK